MDGDRKVVFGYDQQGRRVDKRVYDWAGPGPDDWAATPAVGRKFVWSGWLMLLELDEVFGQDAVLRKYTWGLDLAGQMGSVGVPPVSESIVRKYTWGLDLAGLNGAVGQGSALPALEGAGGIGGLLAMQAPGAGPGGGDLNAVYTYDANGNVGQLVAWATGFGGAQGDEWAAGRLLAHYEYDPYGGVTAQSGTYAAANPVRFSTKYWDDETGLGYWGYRYYSPALGRWISRDPIEGTGAENLYVFVRNDPPYSLDLHGLWAIDVHLGRTYQWARSVGYPLQAAQDVADACEAVDHGWTGPFPGQDQSYHFDRPLGGGDSRLDHFYDHFEKAIEACDWRRKQRDDPLEAARQLGTARHPLQDFVAHGDYGLAGSGSVWYPHNYFSLQTPLSGKLDLWKYPDDPDLDAIGSTDGRPVGSALYHRRVMVGVMSFEADYAMYRPGNQRIRLTERMSRQRLGMYRDMIEDIAGCECCKYFKLGAPN